MQKDQAVLSSGEFLSWVVAIAAIGAVQVSRKGRGHLRGPCGTPTASSWTHTQHRAAKRICPSHIAHGGKFTTHVTGKGKAGTGRAAGHWVLS